MMDRATFLLQEFVEGDVPNYRCPSCAARLKILPLKALPDFPNEKKQLVGIFNSKKQPTFHCNFFCSECLQIVHCLGSVRTTKETKGSLGGPITSYVYHLSPQVFLPQLRMFEISASTPDDVRRSLDGSFNLFFTNTATALNEVRNAVEFLMDHLQVPRTDITNKGKLLRLSLHDRVELMPSQFSHYKDMLLAVKWLGNAGTHASPTSRDDVLDSYELLRYVLDGMFSGTLARLAAMSLSINTNKGPSTP